MSAQVATPFSGIIVLDFCRTLGGAHASTILGDLGAEIIMIEPAHPLPGRISKGGIASSMLGGIDARYNYTCRNKKSITLDTRNPKGMEILSDLIKKADVVLDNYRPGVTKQIGIDYDTVSKINPRIICCSVTGFGSSGPYKDRAAYETIVEAISGLMSLTGEPGRPPVIFGVPVIDMATAMTAAHGIMAALFYRERTGSGQKVETSLLEVAMSLLIYFPTLYVASGIVPEPRGIAFPGTALIRLFKTKDNYIFTGVMMERWWKPFCKALGNEALAADPRFENEEKRMKNKAELWALVEGIFLTRTATEWIARFLTEDIPIAPVNTLDKALADPQVQHLNIVVTMESMEGKEMKIMGNPIRMSSMPEQAYTTPPRIGQNTDEILCQLLKYSQEKVNQLRKDGVI